MIDFIFDFETFGQETRRCAIINCAFTVFNTDRFISDNPYTYDEILAGVQVLKLDVAKQVADGYIVEPSSLEFWAKADPEARKQLKPAPNDLTYANFCDKLLSYLNPHKIDYWWSRSNTFDPALLHRMGDDSGYTSKLDYKLKFWKVRDIRTFIDAKTDFSLNFNGFIPVSKAEWEQKFKLHDSKHDVTADVLRMQKIYRIEQGLDEN